MGKRVCLVLGLVVGLLTPAAPVAGVAGFGDVEPERYYTEPVQWLIDDHIIDTDNSACFAPNSLRTGAKPPCTYGACWSNQVHPLTRMKMSLARTRTKPSLGFTPTRLPMAKTPPRFAPNDTLTRGEVAASLHRLAGKPPVTSHPFTATSHPFTDVTTPWQQQPVAWMFRSGITTGTSPTTFAPDEPVTRGQLATFLYRYKGEPPVIINPASPDCNEFTAVAAGDQHSCALRTDQTIACWGSNNYGESNPPSGLFTAVNAGANHSCGLRTDNTIACWGGNDSGESNPPSGQFIAIAAGGQHSCGLRTDNTIACWGRDRSGQSNPPSGQFIAIAAGGQHSCGLRTDNTSPAGAKAVSREQVHLGDSMRQSTQARFIHVGCAPTTPSPVGAG